jgi:succinate dehydrogenase/fumarate reductase flavoprotein subunit
MMDWARDSLGKVSATRERRAKESPPKLTDDEAEALLNEFHPDYLGMERTVAVGPNAGSQKFPLELAELLESDSPLPQNFEPAVAITTDVLILGGGGAGVSAALTLAESGLSVHLATKLRLGDANTVMAEGGIQSALTEQDSSRRHFADSYVGGHGNNDPELLRILCEQGPKSIRWLSDLGCLFDQNTDGTFRLRKGGGTSVPRVLACRDYTGLEIMRVLKDAVLLTGTQILENHSAVELLDDGEGQITGAVLWDREKEKLVSVSARAVIMATGGSGQLRLQGFPTSNHLGATGDGLILAYRQGCGLIHTDSYQYHPSGSCYPEALAGQLVTESIRAIGAQVLNVRGERFVDEMITRDVLAGAIIREVTEKRGVPTPTSRAGVWLDTPLIELKQGKGTLHQQFPGLIHRFERYGIDPAVHPLLIYPTLHYQNGGIRIDPSGQTDLAGLWAAGEVTGGLHGTNRLMGNSLLDITVFGRRAGESVIKNIPARGAGTLAGLKKFRAGLGDIQHPSPRTAPLLFPVASKMKFQLAEKSSEETPTESSQEKKQFREPPDPFGGM